MQYAEGARKQSLWQKAEDANKLNFETELKSKTKSDSSKKSNRSSSSAENDKEQLKSPHINQQLSSLKLNHSTSSENGLLFFK